MAHAAGNPPSLPAEAAPPAAPRGEMAQPPATRVRAAIAWAQAHWRDPLYRNGYFLMLNSLSGAFFGFIFWMVAARVYDRATVGWAVGVVSAMTLAALIGKFGVDAALIRYIPAAGIRQRRKILAGALTAATALSLGLAASFVFLFPQLIPELAPLREEPTQGALFCAFAAATSAAWVLDGYFIAERRAGLSFLRNLTYNALKVSLPFLTFVAASRFGIPLAWGVGVMASVAVAACALPRLFARARRENGPFIGKRAFLGYAGANFAVNVSEWLPSLILPLMVLAILGTEANAAFYMAWTLASLTFFLTKAVSQSTFAEMSHSPDARGRLLRKGALHSAAVVAPVLIGGALLGGVVLEQFGDSYRADGYPVLLVLLASGVFVAITNLYITLLKAMDARVELLVLPVTLLAAILTGGYLLLGPFGLVGLAAAWLTANAAAAVYALVRIPHHLRRARPC